MSSSRSSRTSHQRLAIPCTELYLRSRMTASEVITTLPSRTRFLPPRTTTLLSRTTFLPPRTALPDHDRIRLECQNTREDRPIGLMLCAPNRIGCTTVTLSNACDPMRDSTLQGSVSYASIVCCQITVQMHAANRRFVQCLVVVGNTQSSCMCIMIMLIRSRMLSIIAMIMIVTS